MFVQPGTEAQICNLLMLDCPATFLQNAMLAAGHITKRAFEIITPKAKLWTNVDDEQWSLKTTRKKIKEMLGFAPAAG